MKTCKICGVDRDERQFSGRRRTCNLCYNRMYHENIGGLRDKVLERSRRKDRKMTRADYLRKKRQQEERWPEKLAARRMVTNAIKVGTLKRCPCSVCGQVEMVHAHHDDYSKPLDVIWLCSKHHGERHRLINRYGPPSGWTDDVLGMANGGAC